MGKLKQRSGWGNRTPVRIFKVLLIISALEVLLWSCCLLPFQSSAGCTGAAQAYYTRETVNLKSTTGHSVRIPTPIIDFHSLELALKAESAWQVRALASVCTAALPRQLQPSQWLAVQSQSFSERWHESDGKTGRGGSIVVGASAV
mmetsp:Transcript_20910/g.51755  ORF Transcript_20910/g.51755 Transcript_20910/m.51755 type:complete len:146 (-) Transcript_20910:62-499(-)